MTTTAPDILGSSAHHVDSDDRLKDQDNLGFLASQPADVRAVWLERCRLLRAVDRLSEADRWEFGLLLREWRGSDRCRHVFGQHAELIRGIGRAWAPSSLFEPADTLDAWSSWLTELSLDYGCSLVPVTLWQHDWMVRGVGGFFRLFPYLTSDHRLNIDDFGAMDQAWNNVRDIAEDGAAGRCYFPAETIDRFDLTRAGIMSGDSRRGRHWADLMSFWLGEYLPTLADEARQFLTATDLHPSVAALRASCLRRYARVERVLRGLDFDYRAFPEAYWAEVRSEVAADALGGGAKEMAT